MDTADWLVGREVLTKAATRKAIRSLAAPGTAYGNDPLLGNDPQPSHVKNRYKGSGDNGGVHINSGIPNHAFYLAAKALKGKAWLTVGPVWYEVLTTRLVRTSGFADMARETINVAGKSGAAGEWCREGGVESGGALAVRLTPPVHGGICDG